MIVRKPSEVAGTKWQDSKADLVASSVHGVVHLDSCMRWSSKDRCRVTVRNPAVVTEYNRNMGGVDLRLHDQILPNVKPHKKNVPSIQSCICLTCLPQTSGSSTGQTNKSLGIQRRRGCSTLTSSCCWLQK